MASKLGTIPPSGTKYNDLRNEFVRILWCKLRHMDHTLRNDQKYVRHSLVRAITQIALHPEPIRTAQTASSVDGVGDKWVAVLKAEKKKTEKTNKWGGPVAQGKYASPAVAVLVSLLDHAANGESSCSCRDLIASAGSKLESGRTFAPTQTIKIGDQTDNAWDQVRILMSGDESKKLMKQRKVNKILHYELTPLGRDVASRVKKEYGPTSTSPKSSNSNAMFSGNLGNGPVKLLIDFREGGGEKHRLFEMVDHFKRQGIPYEVRSLPVGDFLFQLQPPSPVTDEKGSSRPCDYSHYLPSAVSHLKQARDNLRNNQITIFPVIVERKEASDVALSMMDGRWNKQKKRMKEKAMDPKFAGVRKLGLIQKVNLVYTIEGSLKNAGMKCCARNCLYRHGGPTLQEAEVSIEALKTEGYEVVPTSSMFQTAAILVAKVNALAQHYLPQDAGSTQTIGTPITQNNRRGSSGCGSISSGGGGGGHSSSSSGSSSSSSISSSSSSNNNSGGGALKKRSPPQPHPSSKRARACPDAIIMLDSDDDDVVDLLPHTNDQGIDRQAAEEVEESVQSEESQAPLEDIEDGVNDTDEPNYYNMYESDDDHGDDNGGGGSGGDSGGDIIQASQWGCMVCTFENHDQVLACEMCGTARCTDTSQGLDQDPHNEEDDDIGGGGDVGGGNASRFGEKISETCIEVLGDDMGCDSDSDDSIIDLLSYSGHRDDEIVAVTEQPLLIPNLNIENRPVRDSLHSLPPSLPVQVTQEDEVLIIASENEDIGSEEEEDEDDDITITEAGAGESGGSSKKKKKKLKKKSKDTVSVADLKQQCKEAGLSVSGNKAVLLERLQGPKMPELLLKRKQLNEYVPKVESSNTALLVSLYLHTMKCKHDKIDVIPLDKARWMYLAEETGISKESMTAVRPGGFNYDGWSSKSKLLGGSYPLIVQVKRDKFILSTSPTGGEVIGQVLHDWAHAHNKCRCGDKEQLFGLRNLSTSNFITSNNRVPTLSSPEPPSLPLPPRVDPPSKTHEVIDLID